MQRSSEGCSLAQKGAAELRKAQRRSGRRDVAQKGAA
jgi:hypothetical protein